MSGIFKTITGMFKTPKMPKLPTMPDPESVGSKLAAQKKIAERAKGGRQSTILSKGGVYGGLNLAGTS